MKKLIIFLFLIPLISHAQTKETVSIFNGGNCTVSCLETFSNDSLVSAYVIFEAKDDRLPTLKNYFTVSYDKPCNVYKFLNELEEFCGIDSVSITEICRHKVEKIKGSADLKVYDERGVIFHRFSPKLISGIRNELNEWAENNSIKLE
jgi:hypothetical protein